MKKTAIKILCLIWTLLVSSLPLATAAQAEVENRIHLYGGISFDSTTAEEVENALQKTVGIISIDDELSMYRISDFGYNFDVHVDFLEKGAGIDRIALYKVGNYWGRDDQFRVLAEQDILQFLDMETQMIQRYGEPDFRFFYTDEEKYKQKIFSRFMFPTDTWDAVRMMEVCDNDKYLVAHTIWGNITLRVWVNWIDERTQGYLTKLDLSFKESNPWQSIPDIVMYPPAGFQ